MGLIQSVQGLNRIKRWRKGEFGPYLYGDIYLLLPLDMDAAGSGPYLDWDSYHWPLWASSLQIVGILNLYNKSLSLYLYISCWFWFSVEPCLTNTRDFF